jgi:hypothetical protein
VTTWNRHRTSNDSIVGQLVGAAPLSVSAVTGTVKLCSNPAVTVSLPGTIVSSADAIVSLSLTGWLPTAELGPWELTWHPVYLSGARPVWPEVGTDTIIVYR